MIVLMSGWEIEFESASIIKIAINEGIEWNKNKSKKDMLTIISATENVFFNPNFFVSFWTRKSWVISPTMPKIEYTAEIWVAERFNTLTE